MHDSGVAVNQVCFGGARRMAAGIVFPHEENLPDQALDRGTKNP
jgi:hypothetical protein